MQSVVTVRKCHNKRGNQLEHYKPLPEVDIKNRGGDRRRLGEL